MFSFCYHFSVFLAAFFNVDTGRMTTIQPVTTYATQGCHTCWPTSPKSVQVHATPLKHLSLKHFHDVTILFLSYLRPTNDLIRIFDLRPWLPLCLVFHLIYNHKPKPPPQLRLSPHHPNLQVPRMATARNIQLLRSLKQSLISRLYLWLEECYAALPPTRMRPSPSFFHLSRAAMRWTCRSTASWP